MHHRFVVVDGTDVKLNKGMAIRTGKDVHNKPHSQYIEKYKKRYIEIFTSIRLKMIKIQHSLNFEARFEKKTHF